MTRARGRTNLKISVLLVCCAVGSSTAQSNGGFVMNDGRLPHLATGHNNIGAIVLLLRLARRRSCGTS